MPKDTPTIPKFNIPAGLEIMPSLNDIDQELKYYELLDRKRKEQEYQSRLDQEARGKAQVLEKILQGEAETRLNQEQCIHLKPNNQPAVAGQKDGSHNGHYICQLCSKEWTNIQSDTNVNGLPHYLYQHMDLNTVGGPTY